MRTFGGSEGVMGRRSILIGAAAIALTIGTLGLAFGLYVVISAMRTMQATNTNTIDIAQNMSGGVGAWIVGVIVNAFLGFRLRGGSRRTFWRVLVLVTFGPAVATIASFFLVPNVSGVVAIAAFSTALPLQAVVLGVGLLLLSAKGAQRPGF